MANADSHTATNANRLAQEASPYLLQHAHNPVDWWPWGPEALAEAKRAAKPILLSVGYAACHWCHVMAHESFEDEATAKVMNERFVNIKVDREERPDIDQIYMAALHATGEQGGWPLTMFLTSDAEPFFGGTYFPKDARYGRAAFVDVLNAVADAYASKTEMVESNVAALRERTRGIEAPGELPHDAVEKAAAQLLSLMDREYGGTKGAPKFPNAGLFELLWRGYARTGEVDYRDVVVHSLNRIAMGGITDHVGGGFARYSVDERWLVPHFEKMLYDNAQLLALLGDAYGVTGDPLYKVRAEETVAWLNREMAIDGLFASSLDADSEGEEGRFYVWSLDQVREVLGGDAAEFADAYDVSEDGNWEGTNVLNRLAVEGLGDDASERFLAGCRERLLEAREERPRPGRDDKLLADWNGLTIAALARTGAALGRADWVEAAAAAYAQAIDTFERDGRLIHAVRGAAQVDQGFALDYAAMIHAALGLVAAGAPADALVADALRWVDVLETHYAGEHGGYHWTADDAPALITRPDSPADEAVPNANGVMVKNAATLWTLTGEDRFEALASRILRAYARAAATNVFSCASLFNGMDQLQRLASVTTDAAPMADVVRRSGHPAAIVLARTREGHPAHGIEVPGGTAVLCRQSVCSLPLRDTDALARTLWEHPG